MFRGKTFFKPSVPLEPIKSIFFPHHKFSYLINPVSRIRSEGRSLWEDDLKLEYVQVLWRHGDRSPVTIYPNDPNANFWPQGEGMLTQKGMQQHYALGQYLRTRLGTEFVSQHYLRYCKFSQFSLNVQ